MQPEKTVTFEVDVILPDGPKLVERAEKALRARLTDGEIAVIRAVRIFPDADVEKLAEEFIASAPEEDPPVVEKELTYSPTREELDALPDPELKPGRKG